jgi:hypothetical protein
VPETTQGDSPFEAVVADAAAGWFCGPILESHDFGDHVGLLLAPEAGSAPQPSSDALHYTAVSELRPGHQA